MSMVSAGVLTRARVARRVVALVLAAAGLLACALSLANVSGGVIGDVRLIVTVSSLLLSPGWAAAGFLRRAPAAHVWLLTVGVGVSVTLLAAQIMVSTQWWQPNVMLYIFTGLSVPFLLRHAVVAQ